MTAKELAYKYFPDPKLEDYGDIIEYRADRASAEYGRGVIFSLIQDLGWHSVEESLPEIDEEVIALTDDVRGHILPTASRLCFAHRPNPDGYYAKSTLTGRKTHYAPETYGEGGWNIPGVKFWMPCHKLPDEE